VAAAKALGGIEELGSYLGVARPDLLAWMTGRVLPPTAIFLKAVDVLIDRLSPMSREETIAPPAISDSVSTAKPD
jgi:hypothetical protein